MVQFIREAKIFDKETNKRFDDTETSTCPDEDTFEALMKEHAAWLVADEWEEAMHEEFEEEECEVPGDDEFMIAVLGDLHLDPRKMEDYQTGREHFLPILQDAKTRGVATALVSLGDLGESKSVRSTPRGGLPAPPLPAHPSP